MSSMRNKKNNFPLHSYLETWVILSYQQFELRGDGLSIKVLYISYLLNFFKGFL